MESRGFNVYFLRYVCWKSIVGDDVDGNDDVYLRLIDVSVVFNSVF